jgi:hypothetical protein
MLAGDRSVASRYFAQLLKTGDRTETPGRRELDGARAAAAQ